MYLLLVGKDTDPENYEMGFADAIRIARIDFATPSIAMLAIPRDLMVRIPGLEAHQIVEERVRMAYAYGYTYDVPGGGPSLLAQTLMLNFGVQVDHYAVANYVAFEQTVDAIGGIDVYVTDPVGQFNMGWVHMDGKQALVYARTREHTPDRSDLNRIDRQTEVLNAIREQVLSQNVLPMLPTLVSTMDDAILTDLSPSEISAIVCIAQEVDAAHLQVAVIDPAMYTRQNDAFDHELLLPNYDAIRSLIRDFNTHGLFETQPQIDEP